MYLTASLYWYRPHRRPKHKWEENIKVDHKKIGFEGVN
jgi:hypothetical protein